MDGCGNTSTLLTNQEETPSTKKKLLRGNRCDGRSFFSGRFRQEAGKISAMTPPDVVCAEDMTYQNPGICKPAPCKPCTRLPVPGIM